MGLKPEGPKPELPPGHYSALSRTDLEGHTWRPQDDQDGSLRGEGTVAYTARPGTTDEGAKLTVAPKNIIITVDEASLSTSGDGGLSRPVQ